MAIGQNTYLVMMNAIGENGAKELKAAIDTSTAKLGGETVNAMEISVLTTEYIQAQAGGSLYLDVDAGQFLLIGTGANVGISMGTADGDLGFFGVTPAAQESHIADATGSGGADDQKAQINAILTALQNYGLLKTS